MEVDVTVMLVDVKGAVNTEEYMGLSRPKYWTSAE